MICAQCEYESGDDALFCGRCSSPFLDEEALRQVGSGLSDINRSILEKVLPEHLKIIGRLGSGGMATVYEAEDTELGRRVALKVLPLDKSGDQDLVKRFKREARLVASLKHPHIVPFYFMETVGQFHFFTMALMEGGSLSPRIDAGMTWQESVAVVRQVALALDFAHEKGVVHRDIKPDNVIFDANGQAFLADFGIAKGATSTNLTATMVMMGTPAYISPEQVKGAEVGPLSDIYSVGAMFFHMLTGRTLFVSEDPISVVARHLTELPPSILSLNPDLPQALDVLVQKLIEKEPGKRFLSAAALIAALDEQFPEAVNQKLQPIGPLAPTVIGTARPSLADQTAGITALNQSQVNVTALIERKSNKGLLFAGGLGLVLVFLVLFVFSRKESAQEIIPDVAEPALAESSPEPTSATDQPDTQNIASNRIQRALLDYSFVEVPDGKFRMGSKKQDDERPVHALEMSGFHLGRTEVTQALWEAVMEDNPSCSKSPDQPVDNVSWDAIQVFLKRLNETTGKTYRLPTEAEWEYACTGGKTRFSAKLKRSSLDKMAHHAGNSEGLSAVANKEPNDWNLYDMLGNCWEWVADYYNPTYYANSPLRDPPGPEKGEQRVLRGGAWGTQASQVRTSVRNSAEPSASDCGYGFRLARSAQ